MQERIMNLGKVLVRELGLERGVDTLARWMAHYVAEQMVTAEQATGDEKTKAEQLCFDTILRLWHHRSSLPSGHRPFESFEPIFRALDRLDPDSSRPFFFSPPPSGSEGVAETIVSTEDDVAKWTGIALEIDGAARVMIDFAFSQAALSAMDENTAAWFSSAGSLADSDVLSVITRLVPKFLDDENDGHPDRTREAEARRLQSRIDKLDVFVKSCSSVRAALVAELERTSCENPGKGNMTEGSEQAGSSGGVAGR